MSPTKCTNQGGHVKKTSQLTAMALSQEPVKWRRAHVSGAVAQRARGPSVDRPRHHQLHGRGQQELKQRAQLHAAHTRIHHDLQSRHVRKHLLEGPRGPQLASSQWQCPGSFCSNCPSSCPSSCSTAWINHQGERAESRTQRGGRGLDESASHIATRCIEKQRFERFYSLSCHIPHSRQPSAELQILQSRKQHLEGDLSMLDYK